MRNKNYDCEVKNMLKPVAIGLMCLICVLEASDVEQQYTSFSEKLLSGLIKQNAAVAYSQTGEVNPKYNFFNLSGPLYSVKVSATNTQPLKVWGEGTESKFPPFLEAILERVQSYYSVFKYEDLSRPYTQQTTTLTPVVIDEIVGAVEVVGATTTTESEVQQTTLQPTIATQKPTTASTTVIHPSPLFTRKRITFVPVYFDSPPKYFSNTEKPVDV
jgi:hypothetical protein